MSRIILDTNDMPSLNDLEHSASRLLKDYKLLNRMRGNNDIESPEAMKNVGYFLDMLAKREKKTLRDETPSDYANFDILVTTMAVVLGEMEDWELQQTINETPLKKIIDRMMKMREVDE